MRYADLDLPIQLVLIILVMVVWTALLLRAIVFFRQERAGIGPLYPNSWNVGQRQILEWVRRLIGLALIPLWAFYSFVAPSTRTNWPFGYLEAFLLVSMLSVSYAWVLLLAPRNLKRLDAVPRSFLLMLVFLVFWWGTAFSAIGLMFAAASAPTPFRIFPPGVYAARPLSQTDLVQAADLSNPAC
jgi:hypothetical protein